MPLTISRPALAALLSTAMGAGALADDSPFVGFDSRVAATGPKQMLIGRILPPVPRRPPHGLWQGRDAASAASDGARQRVGCQARWDAQPSFVL